MSGNSILVVIICYFLLLVVVAFFTARSSDNQTFFRGNRKSPWFVVAFGMIGASLSGVTFISVPGWVGTTDFSYMQMVLGYMVGYLVISLVLLPIYYKMDVTSIYKYLEKRFGKNSYKTGAFYFLLSKIVGAGFRLFLVAGVLQLFVFDDLGVHFSVTVIITLGLIMLYTFRGGIRTIVWTDTLQTFFMLLALALSIILISHEMDLSFSGLVASVADSTNSKIFVWDWKSNHFFVKQFLSGAFIAMTMTGLDQDMMQKNLSIRSLKESQRNIFTQMPLFIVVNLVFMSLGVLLLLFAQSKYAALTGDAGAEAMGIYPNEALKYLGDKAGLDVGIDDPDIQFRTDFTFPLIALKYLSPFVGIVFIIGLIAAAYSSADSALTALTTSFCVDFLGYEQGTERVRTRYLVHFAFAFILLVTILLFNLDKEGAVINKIFTAAGYTYGPLLGLFAFGIFSKRTVKDKWVPVVCLVSPVLIYFLKLYESDLLGSYSIGHELLIINGLLTYAGLMIITKSKVHGQT